MLTLNCGHCVEKLDDASILSIKSYTQRSLSNSSSSTQGYQTVEYLTVCQPCFDEYVKNGCVVEIIEEQGTRRFELR